MSHPTNPDLNRAFSEGSDARLDGKPIKGNPYPSGQLSEYHYWRRGWRDVHVHFGEIAKWPVRRLVAVRVVK